MAINFQMPEKRRMVLIMSLIRSLLLLFFFSFSSCEFKSKTDLYLERGLDILSNTRQLNFHLIDDIMIEEIGVIRDKKEQKKVLVLKMGPTTSPRTLDDYKLGVRAKIRHKKDSTKNRRWDFVPRITEVKGYKYLIKDFSLKEDKINLLTIFLYKTNDPKERRQGKELRIKNLLTYND